MSLFNTPLDDIRKEINNIDEEMLELFRKRMALSQNLAYYKASASLPIEDSKREFDKIRKACIQLGSPYDKYAHIFMEGLFNSSKSFQNDTISKEFYSE